jgi:hypothetical protein
MNSGGSQPLTREELYEKVWSAPTTQVAAELGISDVALAKRCKKLNVPKPSPGYWAKVAAGQKPKKIPLPSAPEPIKYEPLDAPIPAKLPLPDEKEDLHLVVVELRVALREAKPDDLNQCVKVEERTFPRVTVSPAQIDRATRALDVILKLIEARGIPFRKSRSKYDGAYFERGYDRMNLTIEEAAAPRELTPQEKRRNDWHWRQYVAPTGKLMFKLNPERYGDRSEKKWVESEKLSLEQILSQIVQAICKRYIDLEKERIAAAERNRKAHEEYLIREQEESKRQHAATLEATAHTRSEDLIKAAEWWRLHRVTMDFINECEQRWRGQASGELNAEQQAWLAWARENANAMSPLETGYPDPAKDGAFDAAAVLFGGPYPAKRDFPRPPTMPKIPPPVQPSGYSYGYEKEEKQQYPFWLKYQRR